jgi:hypothetical protein
MNPPDEPPPPKPFAAGWYLAAPWIVAILVLGVALTGVGPRVADHLPFGLGRIALNNAVLGVVMFTILCTALWARRRGQKQGMRGANMFVFVVIVTIGVSALQACAAAALGFVGCIVVFNTHR